jgi:hypothetical protein
LPSEFTCSNTADVDYFRNQFHFMKCAYSPPPDPADALYSRVMDLYGQRRFVEALPLAQEVVAIDEKALGPNQIPNASGGSVLNFRPAKAGDQIITRSCCHRRVV